jgi:hypothetical protein
MSPKYIRLLKEEVSGNRSSIIANIVQVGIPNLYWFGVECNFNIMAMELLGPSLEDQFNHCGRKFTLKTILILAQQMVIPIHSVNFPYKYICYSTAEIDRICSQ